MICKTGLIRWAILMMVTSGDLKTDLFIAKQKWGMVKSTWVGGRRQTVNGHHLALKLECRRTELPCYFHRLITLLLSQCLEPSHCHESDIQRQPSTPILSKQREPRHSFSTCRHERRISLGGKDTRISTMYSLLWWQENKTMYCEALGGCTHTHTHTHTHTQSINTIMYTPAKTLPGIALRAILFSGGGLSPSPVVELAAGGCKGWKPEVNQPRKPLLISMSWGKGLRGSSVWVKGRKEREREREREREQLKNLQA